LLPGGLGVYHGLFFGFAVVGLLLFFLYSSIRSTAFSLPSARSGLGSLGERARKDLTRISFLFSVDAFGGSFVSVYVLTSWFLLTYGVSSVGLGTIFSVTSVITAASVYVAASIGLRLGNLRTMVYTHLISNLLLIGMPLAGALAPALLLLFLRQGLSQMDVPTRQALMAEMFQSDERVTAFALSNTARSVASFAGGPVNTGLLALGALSGVLFVGGFSKIGYDLAIFYSYRKRYR
jgi:MFS family permease